MINKKENVVGTRVTDKQLAILMEYAKRRNITLSELTRDALFYYGNFVFEHEKNLPIIIHAKNEYVAIMDHVSEEGLQKLAEVCYQNSMGWIDYFIQQENIQIEELHIPIRLFLKGLKKGVFSNDGQNWFEKFDYRIEKKRVMLYGLHNLTKNFSIFMKLYFLKIMDYYEHDLIKEDLRKNIINLHFQKREKINKRR